MNQLLPSGISTQVRQACALVERHLAPMLRAVHLYGSALDGGLKPGSDIDLLVTIDARPDEAVRRALMLALLAVSAPPGASATLRALELTVLVHDDIVPWRYPARRELQFGEWLREGLLRGVFEPAVPDPDLAILLTKARRHSLALIGPEAAELFAPVPTGDFTKALSDTVKQWETPADWAGDERNVVLALARIWYSAVTGEIAAKDVAAAWAIRRLPAGHRAVLDEARLAYLGLGDDRLAACADRTFASIMHVKAEILALIEAGR